MPVNVQIVAAMQNKNCFVDNSIYLSYNSGFAYNIWCANSSGCSDSRGRVDRGCCENGQRYVQITLNVQRAAVLKIERVVHLAATSCADSNSVWIAAVEHLF